MQTCQQSPLGTWGFQGQGNCRTKSLLKLFSILWSCRKSPAEVNTLPTAKMQGQQETLNVPIHLGFCLPNRSLLSQHTNSRHNAVVPATSTLQSCFRNFCGLQLHHNKHQEEETHTHRCTSLSPRTGTCDPVGFKLSTLEHSDSGCS